MAHVIGGGGLYWEGKLFLKIGLLLYLDFPNDRLCGGLNFKNLNLERYGGFFLKIFLRDFFQKIFEKNYPSFH